MNAKYIIGGIIILVFLVWGATSFMQTTIQYVSIEQAKKADKTVQVMGKIDFDKVRKAMDEIKYRGWIQIEGATPLGLVESYKQDARYLRTVFPAKANPVG